MELLALGVWMLSVCVLLLQCSGCVVAFELTPKRMHLMSWITAGTFLGLGQECWLTNRNLTKGYFSVNNNRKKTLY